ncbi:Uncharacterized protein HSRCO_1077 [Halanaeroarchaeum sp. HSR-CO]|uniref:DUF5797 family protein n=1 Tax=Halanaeroarchaeum sp. HSR-CO TaxID=2866382 RepID=UPI00217CC748|nr:DUF5797 family protein [Halanaeroarchaeum sp. HSR-CO]UWG47365.1 Uncharacterized protein HSRCO_1077 [Halanaeroarchaeum sp. HSR-CO]
MSLSETARERLADIVELQPTKNKELQRRWEMESGSEVHQYLENELRDYYYRDENSLIRATAEGVAIATGEEMADTLAVHMSDLERDIFAVLAGPDERSQSVVSVLHVLQDQGDEAYDVGEVRRALQTLSRKGVVEKVQRTVPTFRLAVERDAVVIDAEA